MSLLDDVKILTTPNASKAGTLYSIKPDTGLADLDITRATTATRVNSSGIIETVAVDVPQLDYTDATCPSFMVEPQRTNLFTYSTGLPTGGWSGGGIAWNANSVVAPDGTTTGNLIQDSGGSGYGYINMTVSAASHYTFSFYAKRGTATQMKFYAISLNTFATLIPQTDFYPLTNSSTWTRISSTFTTDSSTTSVRIYFRYITAGGNFPLWGLQLEQNFYSGTHFYKTSSYIPTSGATVTRNLTAFSKTGLSSLMSSTEGVFYAEIEPFPNGGYSIMSIGANSNNFISIGSSGSGSLFLGININGSWWVINSWVSKGSVTLNIAAKYKSGDSAFWLNGVEVVTDTDTGVASSTFDSIFNGYANLGAWDFNGRIYQMQVYDAILTDAQLLALTT